MLFGPIQNLTIFRPRLAHEVWGRGLRGFSSRGLENPQNLEALFGTGGFVRPSALIPFYPLVPTRFRTLASYLEEAQAQSENALHRHRGRWRDTSILHHVFLLLFIMFLSIIML